MAFVDVFVGPVPEAGRDAYGAYAKAMGALTLKAGALSVTALWGAEMPQGMMRPLADAVKIEPGEAIVARIIRWKSRQDRDKGWAEMMKTPDMQAASIVVPFDRSRVCYAGFEEL